MSIKSEQRARKGAKAPILVQSDGTKLNLADALEVNAAGGVGFGVNVQDQTTEIIDLHLTRLLSVITLTQDYAIDDRVINFTVDESGVTPATGDMVCLKEGTAFYHGDIIGVPVAESDGSYTATLDTPLDFAFTTVGGCSLRDKNLGRDGSSSPLVYFVSPNNLAPGTQWDVVRVIFAILDDVEPDGTKFGGMSALINGIVLRVDNGAVKNIFNAKTNNDLAAHMYDVTYDDRAGPQSDFAVRARRTFGGQSKNGVVVRLDADAGDQLQVIVQDNLTALVDFQVVAQGHVVQ